MIASVTGSGAPEKRVATPEAFHRTYVEAFNSGDAALLVSLYEQDGVLVPQPGQVVSGHAAIREALGQYQAMGKMTAETRYCITCGDLALASASWQVSGVGPDGRPVVIQGTSADVLRRQADGCWLQVVDHPFGGA